MLAVKRREFLVDPVLIDLAGEQDQLVLAVDDLVQPRPKQIALVYRLLLLWSHRSLSNQKRESCFDIAGNPKIEIAGFRCSKHHYPAISKQRPAQIKIPSQWLTCYSQPTIDPGNVAAQVPSFTCSFVRIVHICE
jgi:hypothetical protein